MDLSIVVPVYNVSTYLRSCLKSLADLPIPEAEFIIVDDGSTDESITIAEEFVQADSRFKLMRANRVGPGEARNIGIRESGGEFLGFLDGDDLVVQDGYMTAYRMLQNSESDFVSFAFCRIEGQRLRRTRLSKDHSAKRIGVTLDERPGAVFASVFWNKIFRKSYFMKAMYPIEEGIYQDILPNLKGFSESTGFDMSDEIGVYWTIRQDRSSTTQAIKTNRNTIVRANIINRCFDYLRSRPEKHTEIFLRKVLVHDVPILIKNHASLLEPEERRTLYATLDRIIGLADSIKFTNQETKNYSALRSFVARESVDEGYA